MKQATSNHDIDFEMAETSALILPDEHKHLQNEHDESESRSSQSLQFGQNNLLDNNGQAKSEQKNCQADQSGRLHDSLEDQSDNDAYRTEQEQEVSEHWEFDTTPNRSVKARVKDIEKSLSKGTSNKNNPGNLVWEIPNENVTPGRSTTEDESPNQNQHQEISRETESRENTQYSKSFVIRLIAFIFVMIVIVVVTNVITYRVLTTKNHEVITPAAVYKNRSECPEIGSEPYFQFPFPGQENINAYMKYSILCTRNYTVVTSINTENGKVTSICRRTDKNSKHTYRIECNSQYSNENYPVNCSANCTSSSFSAIKGDLLLIEIGDSCLHKEGRVELYDHVADHGLKCKNL